MSISQKLLLLAGLSLSLFASGANAQDEPTMVVLPDAAAEHAGAVTAGIVLPDEAAPGLATAEPSRAEPGANAADGLAEAQQNAAAAAMHGLETAIDAVEGARGDIGRANMPDGLPEQVPTDIPAVPEDVLPGDVDLPTPPAPPTSPIGG